MVFCAGNLRDFAGPSWQICAAMKLKFLSTLFSLILLTACAEEKKTDASKTESKSEAPKTEAKATAKDEKKTEAPKAGEAAKGSKDEVAVIKTSEGEMVLEFWPDVAPGHVENFK
jgi:hypothetical protein